MDPGWHIAGGSWGGDATGQKFLLGFYCHLVALCPCHCMFKTRKKRILPFFFLTTLITIAQFLTWCWTCSTVPWRAVLSGCVEPNSTAGIHHATGPHLLSHSIVTGGRATTPWTPRSPLSCSKRGHFLAVFLFFSQKLYLRGQVKLLQAMVWAALPVHGSPLCCGVGLLQSLVWFSSPPPHVWEHVPESVQLPHPPWTVVQRDNQDQIWSKYFLTTLYLDMGHHCMSH